MDKMNTLLQKNTFHMLIDFKWVKFQVKDCDLFEIAPSTQPIMYFIFHCMRTQPFDYSADFIWY